MMRRFWSSISRRAAWSLSNAWQAFLNTLVRVCKTAINWISREWRLTDLRQYMVNSSIDRLSLPWVYQDIAFLQLVEYLGPPWDCQDSMPCIAGWLRAGYLGGVRVCRVAIQRLWCTSLQFPEAEPYFNQLSHTWMALRSLTDNCSHDLSENLH